MKMGFFNFVMICFDALAWPIFALGYPLVASVQAIETNSDADYRKLVIYWVLYSLISLFEHAFMDLLEWVPVWPYVKLVMVCWLMIPRFDGAFHVYNNFMHPCLYMDLETIVRDLFAKMENFLNEAEKYVKANEPEALEKLISSSKSEVTERGIMQKDSESAYTSPPSPVLQDNEKRPKTRCLGRSKRQQIPGYLHFRRNGIWIPKAGLNADKSNIKIPPPVEIKGEANSRISTSQQVQKEWACAMCQVIVSSEIEFKSHLQSSQFSAPPASYHFKTPRKEREKCAFGNRSTHKESNQTTKRRLAEIEKNKFVEV